MNHSSAAGATASPTSSWQARQWIIVAIAFAATAALVMCWRWGGTIEDSLAYFNTARYLRGEIAFDALRAPFPYRLAMPALAALLPGDVRNNFALLNWLAMSAAALMLAVAAARAGLSNARAIGAGLLLLVSVPTFWYAPYLLTDPGSICARAAFVLGVVTGAPWLSLAAGLAGTAVREENILLLAWLLATRRTSVPTGILFLALAGAWLVAVRWWILPGLPSYTWVPNIGTLLNALQDKRGMLSLAAASVIVLPLAAAGWRHCAPRLAPLKGLAILMALPPLYATLSVRVEGRIVWDLYPFLLPIAVCAFPQAGAARRHGAAL
ncbi:hypothetical protein [Massilia sp. METH4]|uniref:hypothetical protein n=1 Tax=Massilia sp. METH4 TaxID=3123041 RepID=UPI0030CEF986